MENLRRQRDAVRDRHRRLLQQHHERFHKVWGQLMKTGYQNSRFAHQLERFACVYTSHVRCEYDMLCPCTVTRCKPA